jgi:hypothetical protein
MRDMLIILGPEREETAEDSSDGINTNIFSRAANERYTDGWERIFGVKSGDKMDLKTPVLTDKNLN